MRKYYTLEDLVKKVLPNLTWPTALNLGVAMNYSSTMTMLAEIFYEGVPGPIADNQILTSRQANALFCTYIAPRYKKISITYSDGDITENEEMELYKDWLINFAFIINSTYNKYAKLIEIYEQEKDNLMDGVTRTSENKFNDTPQNAQGIYSWADDDHLTNVTRTESKDDLGTKIARINEIDNLIKDYYLSWSREFTGLFIL